ncbi:MAG TPA: lycopene cyclase domain-containing protein [Candidatus Sulfomarinibacteraceae bacterium]|nr:lycopene cyclase domain-containing protein [Candidatus Sulfomarinibacteraceae bacterium]
MTYFGFLARFLLVPILLFALLLAIRWRRSRPQPFWSKERAIFVILLHVAIALLYTTPWDNYLVATGVWWYDPALVSGLIIGWVPIEEYTFFFLQPILTSLFLLLLLGGRAGEPGLEGGGTSTRLGATAIAGALWLAAVVILLLGWQPGTYLGLELGWALPPIMLQLIFGADILWRYRRPVLLSLLLPTLYLAAADALAITVGIWTIDPAQSLHLLLLGVLPLEELLFFLLTNTLIVFGVTLSLAPESTQRLRDLRSRVSSVQSRLARKMAV